MDGGWGQGLKEIQIVAQIKLEIGREREREGELLQGPITHWIYPDPQPVVSGLPDMGLSRKISICETLP